MYRPEQVQSATPIYQANGHHAPAPQEYDSKYQPAPQQEYSYSQHPSNASAMAYRAPTQQQQQQPPQQQPQQPAQVDLSAKGSNSNGKYYSLVVAQQPDRARMCGFGDKDRRPITPPPCIRLSILDPTNGREIDYTEIDSQHFILQVDLWDENGVDACNCVQHSNTSPSVSISMATTTSYPPQPEQPHGYVGMHGMPGQAQPYMHPQAAAQNQHFYSGVQGGYAFQGGQPGQMMPSVGSPVAGNYTRNLIGSCSVSAAQLADTEDHVGLWFVLQDLSVRTEGTFRLRFSFINVGMHDGGLNTGAAPVLATAFSERFQVWSAKKFPGVKESTPLSKCFAAQGVKIPIRKNDVKGGGGGEDFDGDEDSA